MRIVAGEWRRRLLKAPPGEATRPTSDRTRETLFNMLASRLGSFEGLAVADLFAGSGALGLEALSRGAATCLFVEQDPAAIRALRANIAALRAQDRCAVQAGSGYLAAYRVSADDALPETLDAILSQQTRETWVALEIAEGTVAVGCALLTDEQPLAAAPLSGLTAQRGNQRPALAALDLLSTERLNGHTSVSADLLQRLDWPTPVAGAHRAPLAEART